MDKDTVAFFGLIVAALGFVLGIVSLTLNIRTNKSIHASQALNQRRGAFFELWPHISHLSKIDPTNPVQVDVIKSINALELTALCWEAGIVDRDMIKIAFLDGYMSMYEAINQISSKLPNGKTGPELIGETPVMMKVYDELKELRKKRASLT